MSRPTTDPLETLVAEGRLRFRPATQFGTGYAIDLDLYQLRDNLFKWLAPILSYHQPLRNKYHGSSVKITKHIQSDLQALLDAAIGVCYNRLRNILEIWNFAAWTSRMTDPVLVNNKTEMPTFLASLLGSIGPLRLRDGVVDKMVVYVPTATKLQIENYAPGHVERLLDAMRRCKIGLSTIDINNVTEVGRAFTTIRHIVDAGTWDTYGTVHQSNYDHEDMVRSYLFASSADGSVPVEDVTTRVGYTTNEAIVKAVSDNAPEGVREAATNAGRPVAHHYRVNLHGVQPAAGTVNTPGYQPPGVYIIGRGDNPVFLNVLAHGVCLDDIMSMIYYRFLAP